jgi:hypothetical protein
MMMTMTTLAGAVLGSEWPAASSDGGVVMIGCVARFWEVPSHGVYGVAVSVACVLLSIPQ